MTEKFGGEILRKYAKIDLSGREAIAKNNIIEHKNFPESLRDRIYFSAKFDKNFEEKINNNLISKLEFLESSLGMKFVLAGRDFPIHSTILEGLFKKTKRTDRKYRKRKRLYFF